MRIGMPVRRQEDDALLRGDGCFIDDMNVGGQCYAGFLRSPYAHARIVTIDCDEAKKLSGVIDVFVAADLGNEVAELIDNVSIRPRDGTTLVNLPRPVLVADVVRHVGDTVAMVIACDADTVRDALELIVIDYEELPAVTDVQSAIDSPHPPIWEAAPDNIALQWESGELEETERAFAQAAHITRTTLENNRVLAMCMETRGVVAQYEKRSGRYVLHTPSQGVNRIKNGVAAALRVEPAKVRVLTPDVGGAFGIKIPTYPEHVLAAWAAKRLDRAIKWCGERGDSFLTDGQCRDHTMHAELALDADGRFLALRCQTLSNMGAYSSAAAFAIPTVGGTRCATGVYAIPVLHVSSKVVFSNTVPVTAYRGAGKPEFNYMVERVVDTAARELNIDPAELRRLNAVKNTDMPYRTPAGLNFDSGDFARCMDEALALGARSSFAERRAEANTRGRLRGFGFALFQEPDGPLDNRVTLTLDKASNLVITTTAQTGGQGHATTLTQIVCDHLGLSAERVTLLQGDSDSVGPGDGTGGSALLTVTGSALVFAMRTIVDKGCDIAAHLMQTNRNSVTFRAGTFHKTDSANQLSFSEVVRASFDPGALPAGMELGLNAVSHYKSPAYSYPCGCHVCEVEIDPDSGVVSLEAYVAVDDHGVVINPLLLEGQLLGGIAQGVGQALLEHCVYDEQSGQLLSGNLMDYCIPRADDLPGLQFASSATPCLTNPLGVKGVGESGCTGALPAVMNAVVDALSARGVTHIDMPATPQRVWHALHHS